MEQHRTLRNHLRDDRRLGDLADILEALALAGSEIGARVRRARINDDVGELSSVNVQGEVQQKLDIISDKCVLARLRECSSTGVYASEEQPEAVLIRARAEGGKYCVLSDPLDGSSNIDVAAGVGTIFSILPNSHDGPKSTLQPGRSQVAAGYILYGSSILMVVATAAGVDLYVLDPDTCGFVAVGDCLQIPARKKIYSVNEGYTNAFSDGMKNYLAFVHNEGYGARYIGSMVADIHRTLLKGGVFIYPSTVDHPDGKLRLMYEANPMAFVVEKAGGVATTGTQRILDVVPTALHQRTPVVLGSKHEVEQVSRWLA